MKRQSILEMARRRHPRTRGDEGLGVIDLMVSVVGFLLLTAMGAASLTGLLGMTALDACQSDGQTIQTAMSTFAAANAPGVPVTQASLLSTTPNFFPAGSFPTGLWQSTPGNCHDWDPSQAVLSASIQSNAYDGYSAMALSGSYGNACETQSITMPASLVGGNTFVVSLVAQTQGPLSSGPSVCIWDGPASECLPNTWSPSPTSVSGWTAFNITFTLPSTYVSGDSLTLFLYSGETDGGPSAVNAYANIEITTDTPTGSGGGPYLTAWPSDPGHYTYSIYSTGQEMITVAPATTPVAYAGAASCAAVQ